MGDTDTGSGDDEEWRSEISASIHNPAKVGEIYKPVDNAHCFTTFTKKPTVYKKPIQTATTSTGAKPQQEPFEFEPAVLDALGSDLQATAPTPTLARKQAPVGRKRLSTATREGLERQLQELKDQEEQEDREREEKEAKEEADRLIRNQKRRVQRAEKRAKDLAEQHPNNTPPPPPKRSRAGSSRGTSISSEHGGGSVYHRPTPADCVRPYYPRHARDHPPNSPALRMLEDLQKQKDHATYNAVLDNINMQVCRDRGCGEVFFKHPTFDLTYCEHCIETHHLAHAADQLTNNAIQREVLVQNYMDIAKQIHYHAEVKRMQEESKE